MSYQVVYSTLNEGIKMESLIPFVVVAAGIVGLLYIRKNKSSDLIKRKRTFLNVIAIFAIIWGTVVSFLQISNYYHTRQIIESNSYSIVEGIVENFIPMPYDGHMDEEFDVNGIHFEYSDYTVVEGFNNTCSHGGPICTNGQQVRIQYYSKNGKNTIIKIEVEN